MPHRITVKTVLVCDDSINTRILLKTVFTKAGFEVLEAEDGFAAQQMALTHLPDLIVIDIIMPGQDGITTIRNLKNSKDTDGIPVVVITGNESLTKLLTKSGTTVAAVFEKPFRISALKAKVMEILC